MYCAKRDRVLNPLRHGGSGVGYTNMTTSLQLQPPEPFSFSNPEGWPRWKRRFMQFRNASGLASTPDEQQTSTLLYCLGEEADDVLKSAGAKEADKATVDALIKKFDEFFATRRNVIYERARFNLRTQQPGESAEQFIIALYTLSEWCEYGGMREELIRDRLVVGILDSALSEKLQLDPNLDLEKAKKAIRLKEAVQESQRVLRQAGDSRDNPIKLDALRGTKTPAKKQFRDLRGARRSCSRCGGQSHPIDKCPAREATCFRCQKKGHFSSKCFSRIPAQNPQQAGAGASTDDVQVEDSLKPHSEPAVYLDMDAVNAEGPENSWTTAIGINQTDFVLILELTQEQRLPQFRNKHIVCWVNRIFRSQQRSYMEQDVIS